MKGMGIDNASLYRCHDLRRGHAKDLQESGAPLWVILEAGEWKSPAFLEYLDIHKLETDLVVQVRVSVLGRCFSHLTLPLRRTAMNQTRNEAVFECGI